MNARQRAVERLERKQSARALREVNKTFYKAKEDHKALGWASALGVSLIVWAVIFIGGCMLSKPAHADTIDMHKIMMIESGGRNIHSDIKSEHAIGIYQITPVVLKEYNQFNRTSLTSKDLFNTAINHQVASWYLNSRIPQMLRAYKKPVTVRNIIIAYNAGISYVVKGKQLPSITERYLRKYGA